MCRTGEDVSRRADSLLAGSHCQTFHDTLKGQRDNDMATAPFKRLRTELRFRLIHVWNILPSSKPRVIQVKATHNVVRAVAA